MKIHTSKSGFTLIEMIVTVGVIIILASVLITTATRIQNKAKEQLTANTIEILNTALTEFREYNYRYKGELAFTEDQQKFYSELRFPLDCSGLSIANIKVELENALDTDIDILPGNYNDQAIGSEVMYFLLSRIPQSKKVLEGIDSSLIKENGNVTVDGRIYPWLTVVDAWGTALRYDLYEIGYSGAGYYTAADFTGRLSTRRAFPIITSAGPDKQFDTADDITTE